MDKILEQIAAILKRKGKPRHRRIAIEYNPQFGYIAYLEVWGAVRRDWLDEKSSEYCATIDQAVAAVME